MDDSGKWGLGTSRKLNSKLNSELHLNRPNRREHLLDSKRMTNENY